ncbi:hypothetical protein CRG98_041383 [Punica granatum]|uniref:Uncharacterized protein n=1 Tax=Punica granatum TaxID=22663 RepID=A0A2I0I454_PUNGR|nr:hypothetical protein CRG98_041383 [Punica granatum]
MHFHWRAPSQDRSPPLFRQCTFIWGHLLRIAVRLYFRNALSLACTFSGSQSAFISAMHFHLGAPSQDRSAPLFPQCTFIGVHLLRIAVRLYFGNALSFGGTFSGSQCAFISAMHFHWRAPSQDRSPPLFRQCTFIWGHLLRIAVRLYFRNALSLACTFSGSQSAFISAMHFHLGAPSQDRSAPLFPQCTFIGVHLLRIAVRLYFGNALSFGGTFSGSQCAFISAMHFHWRAPSQDRSPPLFRQCTFIWGHLLRIAVRLYFRNALSLACTFSGSQSAFISAMHFHLGAPSQDRSAPLFPQCTFIGVHLLRIAVRLYFGNALSFGGTFSGSQCAFISAMHFHWRAPSQDRSPPLFRQCTFIWGHLLRIAVRLYFRNALSLACTFSGSQSAFISAMHFHLGAPSQDRSAPLFPQCTFIGVHLLRIAVRLYFGNALSFGGTFSGSQCAFISAMHFHWRAPSQDRSPPLFRQCTFIWGHLLRIAVRLYFRNALSLACTFSGSQSAFISAMHFHLGAPSQDRSAPLFPQCTFIGVHLLRIAVRLYFGNALSFGGTFSGSQCAFISAMHFHWRAPSQDRSPPLFRQCTFIWGHLLRIAVRLYFRNALSLACTFSGSQSAFISAMHFHLGAPSQDRSAPLFPQCTFIGVHLLRIAVRLYFGNALSFGGTFSGSQCAFISAMHFHWRAPSQDRSPPLFRQCTFIWGHLLRIAVRLYFRNALSLACTFSGSQSAFISAMHFHLGAPSQDRSAPLFPQCTFIGVHLLRIAVRLYFGNALSFGGTFSGSQCAFISAMHFHWRAPSQDRSPPLFRQCTFIWGHLLRIAVRLYFRNALSLACTFSGSQSAFISAMHFHLGAPSQDRSAPLFPQCTFIGVHLLRIAVRLYFGNALSFGVHHLRIAVRLYFRNAL